MDDRSALQVLLAQRRTTRSFSSNALGHDALLAILWAAHGHSGDGHRTTPSAHALHLVRVTVVAGAVEGVSPGAHVHDPGAGRLDPVVSGDHRDTVAAAALVDAAWLRTAPALLLLSADLDAARAHFAEQPPRGRRGERYVWLEAGHLSQNVYLRATELGLGAALVAGLDDETLLAHTPSIVPAGHHPLGLIALGHPSPQVTVP